MHRDKSVRLARHKGSCRENLAENTTNYNFSDLASVRASSFVACNCSARASVAPELDPSDWSASDEAESFALSLFVLSGAGWAWSSL